MDKPDLARIVYGSFDFLRKMRFPETDIVVPLRGYLESEFGIEREHAEALSIRICLRAGSYNGLLDNDFKKGGYFLRKDTNFEELVREAIEKMKCNGAAKSNGLVAR